MAPIKKQLHVDFAANNSDKVIKQLSDVQRTLKNTESESNRLMGTISRLSSTFTGVAAGSGGMGSAITATRDFNKQLLESRGLFSQFGRSISDTDKRIAKLGDSANATRAEVASMTVTLQRGFLESSEAAEKLIIQLTKATGTAEGASKQLQTLLGFSQKYAVAQQEINKHLDDQGKLSAKAADRLKTLAQADFIRSGTAASVSELRDVINAIEQASSGLDKQDDKYNKLLASQRKMKEIWDDIQIAIGTYLAPTIERVVGYIDKHADTIKSIMSFAIPAIGIGGGAALAAGGVGKGIAVGGSMLRRARGGAGAAGGAGGRGGVVGALGSIAGRPGHTPTNPLFVVDVGRGIGSAGGRRGRRRTRRGLQAERAARRGRKGISGGSLKRAPSSKTTGGRIGGKLGRGVRMAPGAIGGGALIGLSAAGVATGAAVAGDVAGRVGGSIGGKYGNDAGNVLGAVGTGTLIGNSIIPGPGGAIGGAIGGVVGSTQATMRTASEISGVRGSVIAEQERAARDRQSKFASGDTTKGQIQRTQDQIFKLRDQVSERRLSPTRRILGGVLERSAIYNAFFKDDNPSAPEDEQIEQLTEKLLELKKKQTEEQEKQKDSAQDLNKEEEKRARTLQEANASLATQRDRMERIRALNQKVASFTDSSSSLLAAAGGNPEIAARIKQEALASNRSDLLSARRTRDAGIQSFQALAQNNDFIDASMGMEELLRLQRQAKEGSEEAIQLEAAVGALDQKFTAEADINKLRERRLKIDEIEASNLDERISLQSTEDGIAKQTVDLFQNQAMGVAATVEQRLKAVRALQDTIDTQRQKMDVVNNQITNAREEGNQALLFRALRRKKDLQSEIVSNMQQEADLVKTLRDGWISAINAMNTGVGMFTKISIDQNTRLGTLMGNAPDEVVGIRTGAARRAGDSRLGKSGSARFSAAGPGLLSESGPSDFGAPTEAFNRKMVFPIDSQVENAMNNFVGRLENAADNLEGSAFSLGETAFGSGAAAGLVDALSTGTKDGVSAALSEALGTGGSSQNNGLDIKLNAGQLEQVRKSLVTEIFKMQRSVIQEVSSRILDELQAGG